MYTQVDRGVARKVTASSESQDCIAAAAREIFTALFNEFPGTRFCRILQGKKRLLHAARCQKKTEINVSAV